eukprot:TRINITY_DN753_c0_g1_i2.p1 TRINITY_DN753_c0_g1~~TRINITY_DN753_c0_g1_i2.p1  ORF type:complete len:331 (+),score=76.77 TRINITY_DN753_c0_g1_i2:30-1022(+)
MKKQTKAEVPQSIPTVVPRFEIDDPKGLEYLEENGYVVFSNVATHEEVEKGKSLAWDYLENLVPGVKRDDWRSWDNKAWPDPYGKGIIAGDAVGHSEFMWFVRSIPNVQKIFSNIWKTDELITSFDGFCLQRPWEYNEGWRTATGWFHLDQNAFIKPGKECVQGFLNFHPAGVEDGGLCVVPKSHTIFNDIFKSRPNLEKRGHFILLKEDKALWNHELPAANLHPIKICCEPGDFVLWDSRVIHCNAPASTARKVSPDETLPPRRLVAYVCMTPATRLTHIVRKNRIQAYKTGQTTSHWPEDCTTNASRTNTRPYKPIALSDQQKKLIPL